MILFYACKKHDIKPCCEAETEKVPWLLASVISHFHIGPGVHQFTRHVFYYNSSNKPVAHVIIGGDIENPYPVTGRVDSFTYNSQQQLVRIQSTDPSGRYSYRKVFVYASGNRKSHSLKYSQGNVLLDSTVYRYMNSTIQKITYHPGKPEVDTAIFVYDQQQNLTRVRIDGYFSGFQYLEQYDTLNNPAVYLGVPSLELDPYYPGEWEDEFLIMMQSPRFSRNNYGLRRNGRQYFYGVIGSPVDRTVSSISSPIYTDEFVDYYQYLEYQSAN
jgi:hypothetical protein